MCSNVNSIYRISLVSSARGMKNFTQLNSQRASLRRKKKCRVDLNISVFEGEKTNMYKYKHMKVYTLYSINDSERLHKVQSHKTLKLSTLIDTTWGKNKVTSLATFKTTSRSVMNYSPSIWSLWSSTCTRYVQKIMGIFVFF